MWQSGKEAYPPFTTSKLQTLKNIVPAFKIEKKKRDNQNNQVISSF